MSQKTLKERLPGNVGNTLALLLDRKGVPTKQIREELTYICKDGRVCNRLLYRKHFELYSAIEVLEHLCYNPIIDYDTVGSMAMYNKKHIADYQNAISLIKQLIKDNK